ncbi:MAG: DNA gyrase inhibitor YacG [Alphaproteobacteria bacterium]|nr:DNA gyrase inhibitor YacG [Alphaproteobacteria bacterium]
MNAKKCVICGKPAVEKYKAFCSARCANIDLGRWLGEKYVIPTDEKPEDEDYKDKDEES